VTVSGSGLGLPIAKRIVEGHGGLIEVRSTAGSGTEVDVTLPIGRRSA
jgi:two-component system cell cycle sensor histidine kinase PleC